MVAVYVEEVAPVIGVPLFDHWNVPAPVAVSVTLPGVQNVVGPLGEIVGGVGQLTTWLYAADVLVA